MAISLAVAYPIFGGMAMNSQEYWKAFLDSGIPEYYLLYNKYKKMEEDHVFDNQGTGNSGLPLQ